MHVSVSVCLVDCHDCLDCYTLTLYLEQFAFRILRVATQEPLSFQRGERLRSTAIMASELSASSRANDPGHDRLPPSGATEPTRAQEERSQDNLVSSDTEFTEDSEQDEAPGGSTWHGYETPPDVQHYCITSSDSDADGEDHGGVVKTPKSDRQRRYRDVTKTRVEFKTPRQTRYEDAIEHTIEDARRTLRENYENIMRGKLVATKTFRDPNVYPSEYSANKRACLASRESRTRLCQRIAQSPKWEETTQRSPKESGVQQAMTLNQFWRMMDATEWRVTRTTRDAVLAGKNYT